MRISKVLFLVTIFIFHHVVGYSFTNCCAENPFFVSVQFLYWKATEDELEFADKFSVVPPPTAILVDGEPQDIDFSWDPGVRIALGYAFCGCDVAVVWTHLHTHSDASASTNGLDLNFLKPTWFPFLLGALADRASADWRFHFNTFDIELGRKFCLGKCIFLHPYTGIRAAWLEQKYEVDYHAAYQFVEDGTTTTLLANTSFKARNDFDGIGLRFGIDANWCFCPRWSFVGDVSTSLLYGRFRIKEVINGNLILDNGEGPVLVPEILTLHEILHRPRFNIQGLLGIQYRTFYMPWKTSIAAGVFYEVDFWINQNQIINRIVALNNSPINATASNASTNESISHQKGNVQLSGFTFALRFDKAF